MILLAPAYRPFSFSLGLTVWHAELLQTGIESMPPVVKAQNLNHWTAREVSRLLLFLRKACIAMNFLLETPFAVSQILYGCVLFL